MDKTELKQLIKKLAIAYVIIFTIACIPAFLVGAIRNMIGSAEISFGRQVVETYLTISILFAFIATGVIIIKSYYIWEKNRNTVKNDEYVRDIEIKYSPAIISMLLDLDIEVTTDYPAMVMYLCYRDFLRLEKRGEEIQFFSQNQDTSILNPHEEYIYRCIMEGSNFDNDKFKKLVVEDAESLGLIKKQKRKVPLLRMWITLILSFIGIGILSSILRVINILGLLASMLSFIQGIIGIGIMTLFLGQFFIGDKLSNNYVRTEKGEKQAIDWKGFKNYVRDYTLISEKEIDYIEILEAYIPYSIALGETKAIEKYIAKNETFREILYQYNKNNSSH